MRFAQDLKGLEVFLAEWFVNPSEGFKAAFDTFQSTDDFASKLRTHLRKWLDDRGLLGRERRWRIEERGSPFAGLEAFGRDRADVFFGRGPEIQRCRDLLDAGTARFLLIEGASGSGKSSLARAGNIPDLLRPRSGQAERRAVTVVPGAAPFTALAEALLAETGLPELRDGDYKTPQALAECLAGDGALHPLVAALDRVSLAVQKSDNRETPPATELILLIDQLEQLFARGLAPGLRERFLALLAVLARSGRVAVMATLRADTGGAARALPVFAELLNDGRALALSAPRPAGLEEILHGPAAAAGLAFEQTDETSLADVILSDARDAEALPLLQFALARLFDSAGKTSEDSNGAYATLRFADYTAMGGLRGALRQTAEGAFGALSGPAQASMPRLIRALTGAGHDGVLEPRQADWDAVAADQPAAQLANALVDARILVRDGARARFAHQEVLSAWPRAGAEARAQARFIRVRDDVAAEETRWRGDGQKTGRLMAGVRLAEAQEVLAEAPNVLAPHREFVRRSITRSRRVQTLTALAAAVFLAVAAGAGWFFVEAQQNAQVAEENASEAERQRQAAIDRAAELAETLDQLEVQTALAIENAASAKANADQARANAEEAERNALEADTQRAQAEESARVAKAAQALAEEREADAEAAKAAAEDALRTATEAANTLIFDLAQEFRDRGLPSDITRQILDEVRALQESLAQNFPDDPVLQRSRAVALIETADMLVRQGDGPGALALYEEALSVFRRLLDSAPEDPDRLRDVSVSLNKIGDVRLRAGNAQGALDAYEEGLEIARRLADTDPGNTQWQRDLIVSNVKIAQADPAQAVVRFEEALRIALALQESGRLAQSDAWIPDAIKGWLAEAR